MKGTVKWIYILQLTSRTNLFPLEIETIDPFGF
jgi:hypothetical protein